MKECTKCNELKELSEFPKSSKRPDGYNSICKVCVNLHAKQYRESIADEYKNRRKRYYNSNIEYIREYKRNNSKKFVNNKAEYDLTYREQNKEKIAAYKKEWEFNKRNEPIFKIKRNLRRRIHHMLKDGLKSLHTFELIGCIFEEFKVHIESQFRDGMTWDNYGPVWHIDHIIPCSSFDLTILEQQLECFNYKNQQPLLVLENLKKGKKIIPYKKLEII